MELHPIQVFALGYSFGFAHAARLGQGGIMNWEHDRQSGEYKSDCGRFVVRKSPGGMWYLFDALRRDRSGNPKLVATLTTLREAQELAEEESEWGPLGENLSPAWPQW